MSREQSATHAAKHAGIAMSDKMVCLEGHVMIFSLNVEDKC